MSFCSENVLEEMQNCWNMSKSRSSKNGFLSKKIHKLAKIVKPFLKKLTSASKPQCWDQESMDNKRNESKSYTEQNFLNEHLEEEYDNHINEMLEQQVLQQHEQQDIRVIAITPQGTFAIPLSLLPWGADYDICLRDDVNTMTRDQIPQVQVPAIF